MKTIRKTRSYSLFDITNYNHLLRLKSSAPDNHILLKHRSNKRYYHSQTKLPTIKTEIIEPESNQTKKHIIKSPIKNQKKLILQNHKRNDFSIVIKDKKHSQEFQYLESEKLITRKENQRLILPTISNHGVLVLNGNNLGFISLQQYQQQQKKIAKLKQIPFFTNFTSKKFFVMWSIHCRKKRFQKAKAQVLYVINNQKMEQIQMFTSKLIWKYQQLMSFVNQSKGVVITINQFKDYFKKRSQTIQVVVKKIFLQMYLEELPNTFLTHFNGDKEKKLFNKEYFTLKKILKKLFYILSERLFKTYLGFLNHTISKFNLMSNSTLNSQEQANKFLEQLKNKNTETIQPGLYFTIFFMQVEIQLKINEKFQLQELSQKSLITGFVAQFFDNLKTIVVQLQTLIKQKLAQNIQVKEALKFMDQYTLQKIFEIQQNLIDKKYSQLTKVLERNWARSKRITQKIQQVINMGTTLFQLSSQKTNAFIKILDEIQAQKRLIENLPDRILCGIFVFKLHNLKEEILVKLNHLSKYVSNSLPTKFDSIFRNLYKNLIYFKSQIDISSWKITEFISSHTIRHKFLIFDRDHLDYQMKLLKKYLELMKDFQTNSYDEKLSKYNQLSDLSNEIYAKCDRFEDQITKKINYLEAQLNDIKRTISDSLDQFQKDLYQICQNSPQFVENQMQQLSKTIQELSYKIEAVEYIENIKKNKFLETKPDRQFEEYYLLKQQFERIQHDYKRFQEMQVYIQQQSYIHCSKLQFEIVIKKISSFLQSLSISSKVVNIVCKFYQDLAYYYKRNIRLFQRASLIYRLAPLQIQLKEKPAKITVLLEQVTVHYVSLNLAELTIGVLESLVFDRKRKSYNQQMVQKIENFLQHNKLEQSNQIISFHSQDLYLDIDRKNKVSVKLYKGLQNIIQISEQINYSAEYLKYSQHDSKTIKRISRAVISLQNATKFLIKICQIQNQLSRLVDIYQKASKFANKNTKLLKISQNNFNTKWNELVSCTANKTLEAIIESQSQFNDMLNEVIAQIAQINQNLKKFHENKLQELPQICLFQPEQVLQLYENPMTFFTKLYPFLKIITLNDDYIDYLTTNEEFVSIRKASSFVTLSIVYDQVLKNNCKILKSIVCQGFSLQNFAKYEEQHHLIYLLYISDQMSLQNKKSLDKQKFYMTILQQIASLCDMYQTYENLKQYSKKLCNFFLLQRIAHRDRCEKLRNQMYSGYQLQSLNWLQNIFQYETSQDGKFGLRFVNKFYELDNDIVNSEQLDFIDQNNIRAIISIFKFLESPNTLITIRQRTLLDNFMFRIGSCCYNFNGSIQKLENCWLYLQKPLYLIRDQKHQFKLTQKLQSLFPFKNDFRSNDYSNEHLIYRQTEKIKIFVHIPDLPKEHFKIIPKFIQQIQFIRPSIPLMVQLQLISKKFSIPNKIKQCLKKSIINYYLILNEKNPHIIIQPEEISRLISRLINRIKNVSQRIMPQFLENEFKQIFYDDPQNQELFTIVWKQQRKKNSVIQKKSAYSQLRLSKLISEFRQSPNFIKNILKFNQFFQGEKASILMVGPSNSGKTSFIELFSKCLWNFTQQEKSIIPIFMSEQGFIQKMKPQNKEKFVCSFESNFWLVIEKPNSTKFQQYVRQLTKRSVVIVQMHRMDNLSLNFIIDSNKLFFSDDIISIKTTINFLREKTMKILQYVNLDPTVHNSFPQLLTPNQLFNEISSTMQWLYPIKLKQLICRCFNLFLLYLQDFKKYLQPLLAKDISGCLEQIKQLFDYSFTWTCYFLMESQQEEICRNLQQLKKLLKVQSTAAKKFISQYLISANSDKGFLSYFIFCDEKGIGFVQIKKSSYSKSRVLRNTCSQHYQSFIYTESSMAVQYFLRVMDEEKMILVVGNPETGKTSVIRNYLRNYPKQNIQLSLSNQRSLRKLYEIIAFKADYTCHSMKNFENVTKSQIRNATVTMTQLVKTKKNISNNNPSILVYVDDISMQFVHNHFNQLITIVQHGIYKQSEWFSQDVKPRLLIENNKKQVNYSQYKKSSIICYKPGLNEFQTIYSVFLQEISRHIIHNRSLQHEILIQLPQTAKKCVLLLQKIHSIFVRTAQNWQYSYNFRLLKRAAQTFFNNKQIHNQQEFYKCLIQKLQLDCSSNLKTQAQMKKMAQIFSMFQIAKKQSFVKTTQLWNIGKKRNEPTTNKLLKSTQNIKDKKTQLTKAEIFLKNIHKLENALMSYDLILLNESIQTNFVELAVKEIGLMMIKLKKYESKFIIEDGESIFTKKIGFYKPIIFVNADVINNNQQLLEQIFIFFEENAKKKQLESHTQITANPYKIIIQYNNYIQKNLSNRFCLKKMAKFGKSIWIQQVSFNTLLEYQKQRILKQLKNKQIPKDDCKSFLNVFKQVAYRIHQHFPQLLMAEQKLNSYWILISTIYDKLTHYLSQEKQAIQAFLHLIKSTFWKIQAYSNKMKECKTKCSLKKKQLKQLSSKAEKIGNNLQKMYDSAQFNQILSNQHKIFQLSYKLQQLENKRQELYQLHVTAFNNINRNEIAELKCLYINYQSRFEPLFQAICVSFGEKISSNSIRKIVLDVNFLSNLKEIKILDLSLDCIYEMSQKLINIDQNDEKIGLCKNICIWMKTGIKISSQKATFRNEIKQLTQTIDKLKQQNNKSSVIPQIQKTENAFKQQMAKCEILHLQIKDLESEQSYLEKIVSSFSDYHTILNLKEYLTSFLDRLNYQCKNADLISILLCSKTYLYFQVANKTAFKALLEQVLHDHFDLSMKQILATRQNKYWHIIKQQKPVEKIRQCQLWEKISFIEKHKCPLYSIFVIKDQSSKYKQFFKKFKVYTSDKILQFKTQLNLFQQPEPAVIDVGNHHAATFFIEERLDQAGHQKIILHFGNYTISIPKNKLLIFIVKKEIPHLENKNNLLIYHLQQEINEVVRQIKLDLEKYILNSFYKQKYMMDYLVGQEYQLQKDCLDFYKDIIDIIENMQEHQKIEYTTKHLTEFAKNKDKKRVFILQKKIFINRFKAQLQMFICERLTEFERFLYQTKRQSVLGCYSPTNIQIVFQFCLQIQPRLAIQQSSQQNNFRILKAFITEKMNQLSWILMYNLQKPSKFFITKFITAKAAETNIPQQQIKRIYFTNEKILSCLFKADVGSVKEKEQFLKQLFNLSHEQLGITNLPKSLMLLIAEEDQELSEEQKDSLPLNQYLVKQKIVEKRVLQEQVITYFQHSIAQWKDSIQLIIPQFAQKHLIYCQVDNFSILKLFPFACVSIVSYQSFLLSGASTPNPETIVFIVMKHFSNSMLDQLLAKVNRKQQSSIIMFGDAPITQNKYKRSISICSIWWVLKFLFCHKQWCDKTSRIKILNKDNNKMSLISSKLSQAKPITPKLFQKENLDFSTRKYILTNQKYPLTNEKYLLTNQEYLLTNQDFQESIYRQLGLEQIEKYSSNLIKQISDFRIIFNYLKLLFEKIQKNNQPWKKLSISYQVDSILELQSKKLRKIITQNLNLLQELVQTQMGTFVVSPQYQQWKHKNCQGFYKCFTTLCQMLFKLIKLNASQQGVEDFDMSIIDSKLFYQNFLRGKALIKKSKKTKASIKIFKKQERLKKLPLMINLNGVIYQILTEKQAKEQLLLKNSTLKQYKVVQQCFVNIINEN